jgi:hypothetical protein
MALQARIKRQGVEYIDGGGAASLSIADDMQHYSDLLSASAQSINDLLVVTDISTLPKLATALNTAYQNIRWISGDLDKYVKATFEAEGVRIVAIPVAKIGGSIVSLNKAIVTMTGQFSKGEITIAAVRKQVKAQAKPIADVLTQFAEEYDMYAGMASTIANKEEVSQNDAKDLTDAVNKAYYNLDKYSAKHGDARSTITNRSPWDTDPKNMSPINDIVFGLESRVKSFGDPESKRYIKDPSIAGAIQGYLLVCKRFHGIDSKKYWDVLNTVAVALERLKNAL